jgi:integrase
MKSYLPSELTRAVETHLQWLATTRRPGTMRIYERAARRWLFFLGMHFPDLQRLSELRRDPHVLAWLRSLCERHPPVGKRARYNEIVCLRRILDDLACTASDPPPPGLLLGKDIPVMDKCLPRPLSPEDDARLDRQLRVIGDLPASALLLTRATGMRIGECIDLTINSLEHVAAEDWALHVPVGKLHSERYVPVDADARATFARMLELRAALPQARTSSFLLPRPKSHDAWYMTLHLALRRAALQAGCSRRPTLHQLRHTFATSMIRAGLPLPTLMRLLGHRDIRMTLVYVDVSGEDLQRQFHLARLQGSANPHPLPALPLLQHALPSGLPGVRQALEAARSLLETSRRDVHEVHLRRKFDRLAKRFSALAVEINKLTTPEK